MQKNSNFLFRDVLTTPPVETAPSSAIILFSALNNVNCRAYILAAKSFLFFYPKVAVVIQDDGDLDDRSISELRSHIQGVTIYSKESMFRAIRETMSEDVKKVMPPESDYDLYTPIRILYLKCLNVIARFPNKKVIFLDSDMLFLKCPDAILKWIKESSDRIFYGEGGSYLAEKFHEIGFDFKSLDIANFNSGLLGLCGTVSHAHLAAVLKKIYDYDPLIFHEWEVEQSIWAVLLADRENPINLDSLEEVYIGSGWRSYRDLKENAVVAHFVGAIRFKNFRYLRLGRDVIKKLKNSSKFVCQS